MNMCVVDSLNPIYSEFSLNYPNGIFEYADLKGFLEAGIFKKKQRF